MSNNNIEKKIDEIYERDIEKRKMLVIFCFVSWNMSFFVFILLPLVTIFKIGNEYIFAIINFIISSIMCLIFWKKQNLIKNLKKNNDDDIEVSS